MHTIYCILVASENDINGYITYVFECLENNLPFGEHYKMVTRLPNWQHKDLLIGDKGYLTYKEIEAGKDCWYDFDTNQKIPYKYTNIYFIKFVEKIDNYKKDIIL